MHKSSDGMFELIKDVVRVDGQGRLMVGAALKGKTFSVSANADRDLLIRPVVIVHPREAWLYENPEAMASVMRGLADSAAGRVGEPIDLARYAADVLEDGE